MIIGDPYKFCFLIERIPEWEDESFKNGIMFVCVEDSIYPNDVRTTTFNCELYHLTDVDGAFMKPVIEPDIFSLSDNKLFQHMLNVTYPEDDELDNDYRYEWQFYEINDAGFRFFSVSNGHKVKLLVCRVHPVEELLNVLEMEMIQYNKITREVKSFVDSLK